MPTPHAYLELAAGNPERQLDYLDKCERTYEELAVFLVRVVGSSPELLPLNVSQMDLTLLYEFVLVLMVATSP